jgi:hypothetical protein
MLVNSDRGQFFMGRKSRLRALRRQRFGAAGIALVLGLDIARVRSLQNRQWFGTPVNRAPGL